jgi:hypothetical protein
LQCDDSEDQPLREVLHCASCDAKGDHDIREVFVLGTRRPEADFSN